MEFIIFDELPSTNDYAMQLAKKGAKTGTAVVATRQTNGRGQHGRAWESEAGGLYISVVIRADDIAPAPNSITVAVGEAVCAYLGKLAEKRFTIKMPNDILYEGKKICGILTELVTNGNNIYGVVGIGINVNNSYTSGISLAGIMGKELDVLEIGRDIQKLIIDL